MAVACLTDLYHRILKPDCPVEVTTAFAGFELVTSIGTFRLGPSDDFETTELCLDRVPVSKKQLEVLLKAPIDS